MDRRGISVTFVALMLAVMMTSSTTATPGVGQCRCPGSEDGQPRGNNTLYFLENPNFRTAIQSSTNQFRRQNMGRGPEGEKGI
ncbi:MAG: hypothetical protein Ct9H90mP16_05360 [Candidatus Poseidoniales archaeon]|nr:MAG: hypothetical protein Ct9H90mP16_05360 [Candidatus Poseidoniales archaeon]